MPKMLITFIRQEGQLQERGAYPNRLLRYHQGYVGKALTNLLRIATLSFDQARLFC